MLKVRKFKFSAFLGEIQKRGGDVRGVHYTFSRDRFIRRIESYAKGRGIVSRREDNGEYLGIRRGFHTDEFTAELSEYQMPVKKGIFGGKKTGVLVRIIHENH